jgi:1,4-alpha-glucan branching enzyme
MSEVRSGFCLVLHGHLPWVLSHGRWPHGEDWLFEAAAETWLPLLRVFDTCAAEGIRPAVTLGLTPILLEQLSSPRFRSGFRVYLAEQRDRAISDAAAFRAGDTPWLAPLADQLAARFRQQEEAFEQIGGDLVAAFVAHAAAGRIEILSSNATHGYHPLLLHEACARAQIRAGLATSERHLGFRPQGIWLPECAYRPPQSWWPPAIHGLPRDVRGTATVLGEEGVRWFFVDTHLVRGSEPAAVVSAGDVTEPVAAGQADWDLLRGWRSELEPQRVVESGRLTPVHVLARCPEVSEQVWSGKVGYPGDWRYLEFHKRHGLRGLRYWRVTGAEASLGDKQPYDPAAAAQATYEQAGHFVALLRERLHMHRSRTGRPGTVCAPFDAELFGHWWHEGPDFLLEVFRRLHHEDEVQGCTVGERLAETPADKGVTLPEGSWGAQGDHRVWLNDELRFYWEVAYRAEDRFIDLWHRAAWRQEGPARELLTEAGRQLLLLQASDWPFVISTRGAVDYGMRRIFEHAGLFDDLCNGVEDLVRFGADHPTDPVVTSALERSRLLDPVFPDLCPEWWS